MKWGPQPKPRCGRPDCNKDARMYGYCMNHGVLLDRNGTPYTQEEVAGMREANRQAQEMDAAIAANPPVIVWRKDRHGIMRAASVMDPHDETRKRDRQFAVFLAAESYTIPAAVERECTDPELLARTEI